MRPGDSANALRAVVIAVALLATFVFFFVYPGHDPWRVFGQFMPGGAGSTALRNVAYFDGAALAKPLLVLAGYVALGALLLLVVLPRRAR